MNEMERQNNSIKPKSFISDPTEAIIYALGIGLLIAFIFPIITATYRGSIRVMFLNIEGLGERIGLIFKFQLIYPLIAGIILLVIAKKTRSQGKAAALLIIGILPFLLLFLSEETRKGIEGILKQFGGEWGFATILGTIGVFTFLAGAHASRIKPGIDLSANLAAGGAGLWLLALFVPIKGQLSIIAPFKMIGRGGHFITVLAGLATLAAMVLMIIAAVHCFFLITQKDRRVEFGTRIIKLWIAQFLVWGAYLLILIIYVLIESRRGGGAQVLAIFSLLIKIVPWSLGLYILVPLGIGEFLIQSPEKK